MFSHRLPSLLILILSFIFFIPQSEAQILNRLKRKADQVAEKIIEDEFDKALAKKVDEEFEKDSTQRHGGEYGGYNRTESALADAIAGGYMDKFDVSHVELPAAYEFDLTIQYEITTEDEDPVYMAFIIPPTDSKYMGFRTDSESDDFQYMVWDLERNVFVMYQNQDGQKTLMKLPNFASIAQADMENEMEATDMRVEKTGEKKKILGYTCRKYIMENDEYYTEAWIARDFPYSYDQFAGLVSTQVKTPGYSTISEEKGYALEMLSREKKDKAETTVMKVIDIDETGFKIDNSEYKATR